MAVLSAVRCLEESPSALERVRYFQRQLLTAEDMVADQEYFRQKLRRHNRFLHGWGVVCGLEVVAAPTEADPWRVRIGPGYALSPQGDEIFVGEAVHLDLEECGPGASTDPCEPGLLHGRPGARGVLYVAIRYAECVARPVRSAVSCGCDELSCEYSRVRDSFEVQCLSELPPADPAPDICDHIRRRTLMECPPCPESPWVVLARVTLPASVEDDVANQQIDNFTVRRQLYSTFVLQEQIIRCCCGDDEPQPEPVPVRVSAVQPPDGSTFVNDGPREVKVTFDKQVQAATVNPQTVFVTEAGASQPVPGNLTYQASTRTATFVFENRVGSGDYTIVVRGLGPQHVTDVDTLALDGDSDGDQGPDFKSTFSVDELN
jgi:hypothetical protein